MPNSVAMIVPAEEHLRTLCRILLAGADVVADALVALGEEEVGDDRTDHGGAPARDPHAEAINAGRALGSSSFHSRVQRFVGWA
ncbi:MAG: hypothetical protein R2713_22325 [Ilumatobacteraceae bacterium]